MSKKKKVDVPRVLYDLDDEQLVLHLTELDTKLLPPSMFPGFNEKPQLSDWERTFIAGIQAWWTGAGILTWRQRRAARLLLLEVFRREMRRQTLAAARIAVASS